MIGICCCIASRASDMLTGISGGRSLRNYPLTILFAAPRRRALFDPSKKPEAISFAIGCAQSLSNPAEIIRINVRAFCLLPNRLDTVRACLTQQKANRRIMPGIVQPSQRWSITRHKVCDQFRHDRKARCTVREYDERGAILQQADRERGKWAVVAPMEECPLARLQTPTEPPRDTRHHVAAARPEALDGPVFDLDLRTEP